MRRWALLMFMGAFPDEWTSIGWKVHHRSQPLAIDYSEDTDVSEVVFRLKDLGEFDSEIGHAERTAMIFRLRGPPGI